MAVARVTPTGEKAPTLQRPCVSGCAPLRKRTRACRYRVEAVEGSCLWTRYTRIASDASSLGLDRGQECIAAGARGASDLRGCFLRRRTGRKEQTRGLTRQHRINRDTCSSRVEKRTGRNTGAARPSLDELDLDRPPSSFGSSSEDREPPLGWVRAC